MTAATTVLGSPHYMSPEQIEGRQITGRSDQWALAVTAYELLAGRKPFDSDSIAALFQQILATQPPDPSQYEPHIPSAARHVFQRALSKSPEQRFETCGEFVEALAQAASATAAPAATRERGSRPNYAAILMGTALVMCAGAFWSFRHFGHPVQAHKALPPQVAAAALPAPDPSLKAGQTRANRRDDLTYVWIAPGVFRMGCSPGDSDCRSDETPHDVTISRGFWLGQTEVPVQAFKHFTLATEAAMPKPPEGDPNWADPSMPISNVSWSSASAYCAWVGGRLPTEAEWEFGARAGSPQPRYGPLDQIAWFASNSKAHAHLVKKFLPNDVGLYDTLGNVWEWTSDFYERDYYAQSPSIDPTGPASGEYRVLRGGSWLRSPSDVRVSLRYPALPNSPDQAVGFRCAAVDMP
jgi:formylglycine-generating enzyme required for sulfatase activity